MTICLPYGIDDSTGSIFLSMSFNGLTAVAMSMSERYKINDSATNSFLFFLLEGESLVIFHLLNCP